MLFSIVERWFIVCVGDRANTIYTVDVDIMKPTSTNTTTSSHQVDWI